MSERVHVNRFAPLYLRDYERLCRPVRASESNGVKWQTQGCKQNWIGMRVRRLVESPLLRDPDQYIDGRVTHWTSNGTYDRGKCPRWLELKDLQGSRLTADSFDVQEKCALPRCHLWRVTFDQKHPVLGTHEDVPMAEVQMGIVHAKEDLSWKNSGHKYLGRRVRMRMQERAEGYTKRAKTASEVEALAAVPSSTKKFDFTVDGTVVAWFDTQGHANPWGSECMFDLFLVHYDDGDSEQCPLVKIEEGIGHIQQGNCHIPAFDERPFKIPIGQLATAADVAKYSAPFGSTGTADADEETDDSDEDAEAEAPSAIRRGAKRCARKAKTQPTQKVKAKPAPRPAPKQKLLADAVESSSLVPPEHQPGIWAKLKGQPYWPSRLCTLREARCMRGHRGEALAELCKEAAKEQSKTAAAKAKTKTKTKAKAKGTAGKKKAEAESEGAAMPHMRDLLLVRFLGSSNPASSYAWVSRRQIAPFGDGEPGEDGDSSSGGRKTKTKRARRTPSSVNYRRGLAELRELCRHTAALVEQGPAAYARPYGVEPRFVPDVLDAHVAHVAGKTSEPASTSASAAENIDTDACRVIAAELLHDNVANTLFSSGVIPAIGDEDEAHEAFTAALHADKTGAHKGRSRQRANSKSGSGSASKVAAASDEPSAGGGSAASGAVSDLTLTSDSEDGDNSTSVEPHASANKKRSSSTAGRDRTRTAAAKRKRRSDSADVTEGSGMDYAAAAAAANAGVAKTKAPAANALASSGAAISSAASALAALNSTPVTHCVEVGLGPRFREGPEGYLLQAKNISELFELQAAALRRALTVNAALRSAWERSQRPLVEALEPPGHDQPVVLHPSRQVKAEPEQEPKRETKAGAAEREGEGEGAGDSGDTDVPQIMQPLSIGSGCVMLEMRAANRNLRARLSQRENEVEALRREYDALQNRLHVMESGKR